MAKRRSQSLKTGASAAAPSYTHLQVELDSLSVTQISAVQKFALLKLTALMERHGTHGTYGGSHGTGGGRSINFQVQKFLKKMRSPDGASGAGGGGKSGAAKENQIFGVPLVAIAQQTGDPIPGCILKAIDYCREFGTTLGIFRKSGVRTRIQKLRSLCEAGEGKN